MRRHVWVAGLLLVIVSCSSDAARVGGSESGGPPVVKVTPDMRIDGNTETLVAVEWVGVRSDGGIAVLQPQNHEVLLYDAAGKAAGSFGGRGSGPAEFQRPLRAGWVGDTLWVNDPLLKRVTFVSPGMELVRTVSMTFPLLPSNAAATDTSTYMATYPVGVLQADTFVMSGRDRSVEVNRLMRVSARGTIQTALVDVPDAPPGITVNSGGVQLYLRVPFLPRAHVATGPNGDRVALLTTDTDDGHYTVTVVNAAGDTSFKRKYAFEEVAIPKDSLDAAVDKQAERVPTPAQRLTSRQQLESALLKSFPPVTGMVLDADGRTWIGLRTTAAGNPWLVLNAEGDPIGTAILPANSRLMAARGEYVYGVEKDDMDVESVVRYKFVLRD